jgi:hypothetical protein
MIYVPGISAANLPREQRISAIHVEIPLDANTATNGQKLKDLYSKRNTGTFPQGVAMRLVPLREDALNFNSIAKLER